MRIQAKDESTDLRQRAALLEKAGNIEKDIFSTESNVHNSGSPVTIETFSQWLMEVKGYKKLDNDPRNNSQYLWDEKISKINKELNNELRRKPEGDYLARLQSLKNDFDDSVQRVNNMRKLPLIEKSWEPVSSTALISVASTPV